VAAAIAMSSAPRTRLTVRASAMTRPTRKMTTRGDAMSPSCRTGSGPGPVERTTSPPLASPMSARNRPIPAPMARCSDLGMASRIASRTPMRTRMVMARPSATMTPIASGAVSPWIATRLPATAALMPIPGATANG